MESRCYTLRVGGATRKSRSFLSTPTATFEPTPSATPEPTPTATLGSTFKCSEGSYPTHLHRAVAQTNLEVVKILADKCSEDLNTVSA